jgi:hypothetical protein
VDEGFLQASLHGVFGILTDASDAQSNSKNPYLVSFDQDFKRLPMSVFGGGNECRVILFRENNRCEERLVSAVEFASSFCMHGIPPSFRSTYPIESVATKP